MTSVTWGQWIDPDEWLGVIERTKSNITDVRFHHWTPGIWRIENIGWLKQRKECKFHITLIY